MPSLASTVAASPRVFLPVVVTTILEQLAGVGDGFRWLLLLRADDSYHVARKSRSGDQNAVRMHIKAMPEAIDL